MPYKMLIVPSRFAGLDIVEDDFLTAINKQTKEELSDSKSKKNDNSKFSKNSKNQVNNQTKEKSKNSTLQQNCLDKKIKKKSRKHGEERDKPHDESDDEFSKDLMKAIKLSTEEFENGVGRNETFQEENKSEHEECPEAESVALRHKGGFHTNKDPDPLSVSCKKKPKQQVDPELSENLSVRAPPTLEQIKQFQLSGLVENKDKEIKQLLEQMERTNSELNLVKTRNKKLCNIIGLGEMKTKADLLIEIEDMKEVHTELNAEIERLNALLQQERSRCSCAHRLDKRKKGVKVA